VSDGEISFKCAFRKSALRVQAGRVTKIGLSWNRITGKLIPTTVSAGRPVRRLDTLLAVGSASWSAQADREQLTAIRTWARHHGRPISARGPIPAAVVQAYLNAAGP
jgi:hypothetical protein